ncbi:hypothetical protein [Escherichia phage vB-Eco-KMB43]|nr:hypothetical protein [Escherichia phage vB-Eco-KMB43]
MKILYKHGWYKVKAIADGVKYEVTVFDGFNTYCEDVKLSSMGCAYDYCKQRIDNKANCFRPAK